MSMRIAALFALLAFGAPAAGQGLAGDYLAGRLASAQADHVAAAHHYGLAAAADKSGFLRENAVYHLVAAGDFDAALDLAKRDADASPSQLDALVRIVGHVRAEEFPAALALLDSAEIAQNTLLTSLLRGWLLAGSGQIEAGLAAYAKLDPKEAGDLGRFQHVLLLAVLGDLDGARALLDQPPSVARAIGIDGLAAEAQILTRLGLGDQALERLAEATGGRPVPLLEAVADAIRGGETRLPLAGPATIGEGGGDVFYMLATVLETKEASPLALLYARLAQVLRPDRDGAWLLSAQLLAAEGQFALAGADYARIGSGSPFARMAGVGRADVLSESGDTDAAIAVLSDLIREFPRDRFLYVARGDLARRDEHHARAIEDYDMAEGLFGLEDTPSWRLYYVRGICHEQLDHWEAAEADFRRALEINPEQPLVLNYLGYSLVEKRMKIDEARAMIEQAVALRPDDGFITDSLAWVLYRLGDYEAAVAPMERAVELEPLDPILNDHLGDILWMVGRRIEARFQWRRALSFDPTDTDRARIRRKLELGLDAVLAEEE